MDGGWRVISVWDSNEDFQRFRDESLMPAMQEAGGSMAPSVETKPVFRHITA
jgi:heme-degrading monooxygenase HmoA